MVYVVESADYAPGKREEAMDFLKKVAGYYKKTAGLEVRAVRRVTPAAGQQARLTTIFTIDSLSAWDDMTQKKAKDPEWKALVGDVFVPGKGCLVHNTFSRLFLEVI
jgi:hypothetical protein